MYRDNVCVCESETSEIFQVKKVNFERHRNKTNAFDLEEFQMDR